MNRAVWKARLLRASIVVAALVAIAPASSLIAGVAESGTATNAANAIRASALVGAADPFTAVERIRSASHADDARLPDYFQAEIGLVEGARDVRVGDGGTVVGFSIDEPADRALQLVSSHMGQVGWHGLQLGGGLGATFVKQEGECTWTLVTCTQTGSATSVVYRSVVG